MYVAAHDIHDKILDYDSKIMQFRVIQKPGGRFQVPIFGQKKQQNN